MDTKIPELKNIIVAARGKKIPEPKKHEYQEDSPGQDVRMVSWYLQETFRQARFLVCVQNPQGSLYRQSQTNLLAKSNYFEENV